LEEHLPEEIEMNSSEDNSEQIEYPAAEKGPKTYKNVYKGHFSSKTIKGVNFYGPNSEFVMTGSDDNHIYIWDKETTELVTVLEGHRSIVNCIIGHPTQPMIASSGIDSVVKLWQNVSDYPTEEILCKKKSDREKVVNASHYHYQNEPTLDTCLQQ